MDKKEPFVGEWHTRPEKSPDGARKPGKSAIYERYADGNDLEQFFEIDDDLASAICRQHNHTVFKLSRKVRRLNKFVASVKATLDIFEEPG